MTTLETVKAWTDEEFRDTLTLSEREKLPAHPAGVIEFKSPRLDDNGRFGPIHVGNHHTVLFCTFSGRCTLKGGHCR